MTNQPHLGFRRQRRPLRWPLLGAIAVFHLTGLYWLAFALAPEMSTEMRAAVVSAFTLPPAPPPEPPPAAPLEQDASAAGAAGAPGTEATARAVTAPAAAVTLPERAPAPRASSTGSANRSGAAQDGEGTGASGNGEGTGSGQDGSGRGSGLASRPVHISGEINNARDYPVPAGGRAARSGTEVIVRVIVGTDGRARDCSIYRPSPDPEADRLTCQLVETRLRFRPATDSAGNPVTAPFFWRQRWF